MRHGGEEVRLETVCSLRFFEYPRIAQSQRGKLGNAASDAVLLRGTGLMSATVARCLCSYDLCALSECYIQDP